MDKRIFIIIVLCFFSISLYSGTKNAGLDYLIAEVYLKNSIQQFDEDNFEEAFSLADIAHSFTPDISDTLFILAVSGRNLGLNNAPAAELSNAIILDNWKNYSETTARVYMSKFMYLDGDIDQAYLNLLPFCKRLADNSYFTELFIRMALGAGNVAEAIRSAEGRLSVDPYDSYPQLIMALYDAEWYLEATKILSEGDPAKYISQDVVQNIILNSSDCSYLRQLYLDRWGDDRFFKLSNICSSIDLLSENLTELYPDNSIVNSGELKWLYSQFEDDNSRNLIMEKLNSIDLTIEYDSDKDGFNETKADFTRGKLSSFSIDSNNDEIYDYLVKFNNTPLSLIVNSGEEIVTYFYQNYPNLIKVSKSDEKSFVEYQLIPYKLSLDIIVSPLHMIKDLPRLLINTEFPDNDILTRFSTKKSFTNRDNNVISNYSIVGLDESVEKILNSGGVKILERNYKNSILITAYKDSDSDGVFDTIYDYKDGLLQTISFDANNNGIAEYTENYVDGLVSTWDFNEDGLIDSRERSENGIIYREISSQLNGVFDASLEIPVGRE